LDEDGEPPKLLGEKPRHEPKPSVLKPISSPVPGDATA